MKKGFTLIETIVTIAVSTIVFTALMFVIRYFYRTNAYVFEQTAAVESAREGVINAMSDLREASYGADGSYPVVSASDSAVTFYAEDKNNSNVIDKIHYYLDGETLYRGTTEPVGNPPTYSGQPEQVKTIATHVVSTTIPVFRYYGANGALLASPIDVADITSVNTTVTVNLNPARAPDNFTLSAGATLRNLRGN
ncbi:MAG TPA: type II secretion system protein [Candidatus Kaiserbacteria bacterium]|nr:type II secretion system protein [Candidatus Kaiserbacteria bacterium]